MLNKPLAIVIFGENCNDVFVYGSCDRLSPEAPVPVIKPHKKTNKGGMACNVLENFVSLDPNSYFFRCSNSEPILKTRYIESTSQQHLIRIDEDDEVERIDINNCKEEVYLFLKKNNINKPDAIVISDYNKGFLTKEDILEICDTFHQTPIFMDTKKKLGDWAGKVDYVKINEKEYLQHSNMEIQKFLRLKAKPFKKIIVTMGEEGCKVVENGAESPIIPIPKAPIERRDVAGAGDTFLAAFVLNLLRTNHVGKACKYANMAASIVVNKKGVETVSHEEIKDKYGNNYVQ